jgi:hypothetical protein
VFLAADEAWIPLPFIQATLFRKARIRPGEELRFIGMMLFPLMPMSFHMVEGPVSLGGFGQEFTPQPQIAKYTKKSR